MTSGGTTCPKESDHYSTDAVCSETKPNGEVIHPKIGMITAGHLDPQIGTYRTDAPTTSWVAVQVAVTLAASMSVFRDTFDVSAAF